MTDINKLVENINIPKQLLDKGEKLFKALFEPSIKEIGEILSDNIKLRRFKNQVTIFTKAQKILKDKNINPKNVSLKVLAPLIEYSSYEEEKSLQDKWAYLISQIVEGSQETSSYQMFIRILNLVSSKEAKVLDYLYDELQKRRKVVAQKNESLLKNDRKNYKNRLRLNKGNSRASAKRSAFYLDSHVFLVRLESENMKTDREQFKLTISNLVALGVLKWKLNINFEGNDNIQVYDYSHFIFTHLGEKFVESCRK